MSVAFSSTHLRVPGGFAAILEGLTREILRDQPEDIPLYAARYFSALLKQREESGVDPAEWAAKLKDKSYYNHVSKSTASCPDKEAETEEAVSKERLHKSKPEDESGDSTDSDVSENTDEDNLEEKKALSAEALGEESTSSLLTTDTHADGPSGADVERAEMAQMSVEFDSVIKETDNSFVADHKMSQSEAESKNSLSSTEMINVDSGAAADEIGTNPAVSVEDKNMEDNVENAEATESNEIHSYNPVAEDVNSRSVISPAPKDAASHSSPNRIGITSNQQEALDHIEERKEEERIETGEVSSKTCESVAHAGKDTGDTGVTPNAEDTGDTGVTPNAEDTGDTVKPNAEDTEDTVKPNAEDTGDTGVTPNAEDTGDTGVTPNAEDTEDTGVTPNENSLVEINFEDLPEVQSIPEVEEKQSKEDSSIEVLQSTSFEMQPTESLEVTEAAASQNQSDTHKEHEPESTGVDSKEEMREGPLFALALGKEQENTSQFINETGETIHMETVKEEADVVIDNENCENLQNEESHPNECAEPKDMEVTNTNECDEVDKREGYGEIKDQEMIHSSLSSASATAMEADRESVTKSAQDSLKAEEDNKEEGNEEDKENLSALAQSQSEGTDNKKWVTLEEQVHDKLSQVEAEKEIGDAGESTNRICRSPADHEEEERPNKSEEGTTVLSAQSTEKEECSRPQEEEDIMDIPLDDPEANRAAAKIQAGFRGHMTRKKMKPEDKAEAEERQEDRGQ